LHVIIELGNNKPNDDKIRKELEKISIVANHQRDDGNNLCDFQPWNWDKSICYYNHDLDYILFGLNACPSRSYINQFQYINIQNGFNIDKVDHCNIIHHPSGETKKITFRNNKIVKEDINDKSDRIHYAADTENGSSGAPVFDDKWNWIAINTGDSDKRRYPGYNTGILLTSIIENLKTQLNSNKQGQEILKDLRIK